MMLVEDLWRQLGQIAILISERDPRERTAIEIVEHSRNFKLIDFFDWTNTFSFT